MKKIMEKLREVHNLLFQKKDCSLITDTGTNEDGWVVYTVSCKKENLMKKVSYLRKVHEEGYPVK